MFCKLLHSVQTVFPRVGVAIIIFYLNTLQIYILNKFNIWIIFFSLTAKGHVRIQKKTYFVYPVSEIVIQILTLCADRLWVSWPLVLDGPYKKVYRTR